MFNCSFYWIYLFLSFSSLARLHERGPRPLEKGGGLTTRPLHLYSFEERDIYSSSIAFSSAPYCVLYSNTNNLSRLYSTRSMLLKVLLILSLVFITITESLIAYYELEDEETRRPAAAAHHRQPQPQHHSRLSSEMTEEAAAEDDKPLSSPLLFTRMARQDMRICGTQLLKGLMKICGGCVKTPGNDNATTKRSGQLPRQDRNSN